MLSMCITQRIVGEVTRIMAYPRDDVPDPWVDRVWIHILQIQDEC